MTDLLKKVTPLFRDHVFAGRSLLFLEKVDSTNLLCLRTQELLAMPGLLVHAAEQTNGIGRMGRHWEAGESNHLFCSFIIHPEAHPENTPIITLLSGLAVHNALTGLGCGNLSIKWPNDILISGKKVAGILCQSKGLSGTKLAVVVGIGVNVCGTALQFPQELRQKATTLVEQGIAVEVESLRNEIAKSLEGVLIRFHAGKVMGLIDEWSSKALCIGRMIRFKNEGKDLTGTIIGIDHRGRLLVQGDSNTIYKVVSGEIDFAYDHL